MNETATYTRVTFPQGGDAYRAYGAYHAANVHGGGYLTLCGKLMHRDEFHCFSDEKHTVTCRACRKALGQ